MDKNLVAEQLHYFQKLLLVGLLSSFYQFR